MRRRIVNICSSIAVLRLAPIINDVKNAEEQKSEACASNLDSEETSPGEEKQLIGAQVFFRHGARTPLHVIPSDGVHLKEALWKPEEMLVDVPHTVIPFQLVDLDENECGERLGKVEQRYTRRKVPGGSSTGQLTCLGQKEMFQLGQHLRQRYVEDKKLLHGAYDPTNVYCRSTFIRRNILSARCLLAGLFDRKSLEDRPDPVLIHTCIDSDEILYMNTRRCRLLSYNMENHKPHEFHPEIKETRNAVAKIVGLEDMSTVSGGHKNQTSDACPIYYLRDDLVCRMHHGFEVPEDLAPHMEAMSRGSSLELGCEFMGDEKTWDTFGLRAAIGCVCQMILENVSDQLAGHKDVPSLFLYSTHDSLLVPLLSALGLFDGLWPPFAASVAIEVYRSSDGNHSVHVYYNHKLLHDFSLRDFIERLQHFATTDKEYHTVCNITPNPHKLHTRPPGM